MGKKSNKKNKPSKAEKRRQQQRRYDLSFSKEHLDEMEEHFGTIVFDCWDYFAEQLKAGILEEHEDEDAELKLFNDVAILAEEAWNTAVLSNSLDDAYDTIYANHDQAVADIIAPMIQYKIENYPQDKVLICKTEGQRKEDGELFVNFKFDYTVMDDELDKLEAKENDEIDWNKVLDQDAIARALEGVPEEFRQYAYEAEVKRQIEVLRKRFDDILAEADKDAASSEPSEP